MKQVELNTLTAPQLVDRFAAIGMQQYKALLVDDITTYKPLFWQMAAVEKKLKALPGDQRRALLTLFDHPNMQVRLAAAKSTLALAPKEARRTIEEIAVSRWFPQAGDAGMCLWALDEGIFVPD